jgi:hypothetical protein
MSYLSEVQRKDKFGPFVAFHEVAPFRRSLRSLIFVPMTYLKKRLFEGCPRQLCYTVANRDGEKSGCSAPPARKKDGVTREKTEAETLNCGMNDVNAIGAASPLLQPSDPADSRNQAAGIRQHGEE